MARFYFYSVLWFSGLVALPMVQMVLPFVRERELAGAQVSTGFPQLSANNLWDGSFQSYFELWFSENLGFRSSFVRTDNQVTFSLFKERAATEGTAVIVGKKNYLFESIYVDRYNRIDTTPPEKLAKIARDLKSLQDGFHALGKSFLLLISPSKAEFIPQYIPKRFLDPRREQRQDDYAIFRAELEKNKVTVFDVPQWFAKENPTDPYPIFSKSGTHWNYYAACLVTDRIRQLLSAQLGKPLRRFSCTPVEERIVPEGFDFDLAELFNLWSDRPFYGNNPYPLSADLSEGNEYRPNMLFIGTSFLWNVLGLLDDFDVYRERDFYYYFHDKASYDEAKTRENHWRNRLTGINKSKIDWDVDVFSRDAVVIEINQSNVERTGFGFVEEAIRKLRKQKRFNLGSEPKA